MTPKSVVKALTVVVSMGYTGNTKDATSSAGRILYPRITSVFVCYLLPNIRQIFDILMLFTKRVTDFVFRFLLYSECVVYIEVMYFFAYSLFNSIHFIIKIYDQIIGFINYSEKKEVTRSFNFLSGLGTEI